LVDIQIYDMRGQLVRRLDLGHQSAGYYDSRHRAAHWDGQNETGEFVSSGLYFYQLRAGDYTATRRMVILK
jgi:flagellar hook assembly protein FlgD